jgi:hypothetical protein
VPRSSSWPRIAPPQVCVVDTCSLANMKRADVLRANERFAFFAAMTPMLSDGRVAFPKQVASEMARAQCLDTPGDWAIGSRDLVVYPAPSDEAMAEVLGAAQLLDPQAEREEADAYVVAMAWDIREHYTATTVFVVSDDVKDRMPRKESVRTACTRLAITCWSTTDFVEHVRSVIAGPQD